MVEEKPFKQFNVVEHLAADPGECAWDQPCHYGHRVDTHAVYCHNTEWEDSPRKCRRGRNHWVYGDNPHEDCPGFKPNEHAKE
jgi:hypothetical protein